MVWAYFLTRQYGPWSPLGMGSQKLHGPGQVIQKELYRVSSRAPGLYLLPVQISRVTSALIGARYLSGKYLKTIAGVGQCQEGR